MASVSEKSFGQRYTKARDLVEYMEELPGFDPGVAELEAANLSTFLDTVDTANSDVASKLSAVQTVREERYNMFNSTTGIITRCSQIRDYIGSIHTQHKKALDYKKVQKAVQKMRGIRLTKKTATNPEEPGKKTRSTSERSFGSILQSGKDVLEVVKTVGGYAPSNTNITIANYTTFLASVDTKNQSVAEKHEQYDDAIEARLDLYKQLAERVSKIKLAVAAQYGKDSNEYKDVVKY